MDPAPQVGIPGVEDLGRGRAPQYQQKNFLMDEAGNEIEVPEIGSALREEPEEHPPRRRVGGEDPVEIPGKNTRKQVIQGRIWRCPIHSLNQRELQPRSLWMKRSQGPSWTGIGCLSKESVSGGSGYFSKLKTRDQIQNGRQE